MDKALKIAQEQGLDLVEISPGANPPVCKIIDYNKFLYDEKKKKKEMKAKAKTSEVKEIKREVIETRAIVDIMNNKVSKKPEYLSVGEAAIKLGLSERTIRDRIKVGEIKAFKGKGEKSYQIPVKEFYESMNRVRSLKFTRSIS